MPYRSTQLAACLLALTLVTAAAIHAEPSPVQVRADANALSFAPAPGFSHGVLTVRQRGVGVVYEQAFSPGQGLVYSLETAKGQPLADGQYVFEVRMVGGTAGPTRLTGRFEVVAGSITPQTHEDDGGGALIEIIDVVTLGDAIVEGRICASDGQECDFDPLSIVLDEENFDTPGFGHAEVKLKDDIPEIWFADTTSAHGDFAITVEESRFLVRDPDADTLPFTIESGAPSDSIYVTATGQVGVNTAVPNAPVHIVDPVVAGNTVVVEGGALRVLRVNDNANIRFSAGIHTFLFSASPVLGSFSIRDQEGPGGVPSVPFFIDNDQPTHTFRMTGGRVGIGTADPAGKLDVNGSIFQRGGQLHADYVFEAGYEMPTIAEHTAKMWSQGHLPAVPARRVDESGQEIMEIGAHRRGMLEELELAHIYIAQLEERLAGMADLEERLAKLEAQLAPAN